MFRFVAMAAVALSLAAPAPARALPDIRPEIFDVQVRVHDVGQGDVDEGCAGGVADRRLIEFSLRTHNDGPTDLILGDPGCPNCTLQPGATCANPLFVCGTSHGHAHFESFASTEIFDADMNLVAQGQKYGFCLLDGECPSPRYSCSFQGISAGCSDVYGAGLPCQYVDVTDAELPDGDYVLRVSLDPDGAIAESNETNNSIDVPIFIGTTAPACSELPDGSPCDDHDACTVGGTCQAGACVPDETLQCDPCLVCDEDAGCVVPGILYPCQDPAPRNSSLSIRRDPGDASRDAIVWKWKSQTPFALDDLGAPDVSTDLTLCVYAAGGLVSSSTAPAAATCAGEPCWSIGGGTAAFADKAAAFDGIKILKAKAGERGQLQVRGAGDGLDAPQLPLQGAASVRLIRSDGTPCWEAAFSDSTTNTAERFKAKSD